MTTSVKEEVKQEPLWIVADITKTLVRDRSGKVIYDGADYEQDYQTAKENAELIASAPELKKQNHELLEALKSMYGYIENGTLVRNIENDDKPDWARRMLQFVQDLKKTQELISKSNI